MLSPSVTICTSPLFLLAIILLACISFFFFIISSIGIFPVSARRMFVGVCWGRWRMVFRALLNIVSSWSDSFFVGSHASEPYVMIGIMVAYTSCHTASILIPWNSLLPVSTIISWVAACIFPFSVSIWASRFPLLFIILPRYLYAGTSSSITPFRLICVFGPLPSLTILHLGAPNSMWFFKGYMVGYV